MVAQVLVVSAEDHQKVEGTYHQQSHEGALQEPHQHVAPVVFIIRHPGQARVNGGSDEEELECGSEQPSPAGPQTSLQVELRRTNGFSLTTEFSWRKTGTCTGTGTGICLHLLPTRRSAEIDLCSDAADLRGPTAPPELLSI